MLGTGKNMRGNQPKRGKVVNNTNNNKKKKKKEEDSKAKKHVRFKKDVKKIDDVTDDDEVDQEDDDDDVAEIEVNVTDGVAQVRVHAAVEAELRRLMLRKRRAIKSLLAITPNMQDYENRRCQVANFKYT